jgi:hypothetical protein
MNRKGVHRANASALLSGAARRGNGRAHWADGRGSDTPTGDEGADDASDAQSVDDEDWDPSLVEAPAPFLASPARKRKVHRRQRRGDRRAATGAPGAELRLTAPTFVPTLPRAVNANQPWADRLHGAARRGGGLEYTTRCVAIKHRISLPFGDSGGGGSGGGNGGVRKKLRFLPSAGRGRYTLHCDNPRLVRLRDRHVDAEIPPRRVAARGAGGTGEEQGTEEALSYLPCAVLRFELLSPPESARGPPKPARAVVTANDHRGNIALHFTLELDWVAPQPGPEHDSPHLSQQQGDKKEDEATTAAAIVAPVQGAVARSSPAPTQLKVAAPESAALTPTSTAATAAASGALESATRVEGHTVRAVDAPLAAVFATIDKNHDGAVTRTELLLALRRDADLAEKLQLPAHVRQEGGTRARFERVFAEIDADGSDSVSLREMHAYFLRHGLAERASAREVGTVASAPGAADESAASTTKLVLANADSEATEAGGGGDRGDEAAPTAVPAMDLAPADDGDDMMVQEISFEA